MAFTVNSLVEADRDRRGKRREGMDHFVLILETLDKLESVIRSSKGNFKDLEELYRSFTTIRTSILNEEVRYWIWKGGDIPFNMQEDQDLADDIEELLDRWIAETFTSQKEVYDGEENALIGISRALNYTHLDDEGSNSNNSDRIAQIHDKVSNFFLDCLRFTGVRNFLLINKIRVLRRRLDKLHSNQYPVVSTPLHNPKMAHSNPVDIQKRKEIFGIGRGKGKEEIIDYLLSLNGVIEERHEAFSVISIVGAMGIGKTTLAQLVFNNERVASHFDIRIWVGVYGSDERERLNIYTSDGGSTDYKPLRDGHDLVTLQCLEERVRGLRFLIVVDNASSIKEAEWMQLRNYLDRGTRGSRILLTTRNHKVVPRELGKTQIHYLQPLDDDACWELFCSYALKEGYFYTADELKVLRLVVIKTTGGVPLFVIDCAQIWASNFIINMINLACKGNKKDMPIVNLLKIWDYAGLNRWDGIATESLKFCYYSLHPHLKPCLKYYLLLPEGYWIVKDVFIQLWMAEGFLNLGGEEEEETGENLEKLGGEYFNDLLSGTCFFKDIERDDDGNVVRCKLHEPFHHYICYASQNDHDFIKVGITNLSSYESIRHLSIFCVEDTTSLPTALYDAKRLRTLLCFGNPKNLTVPRELFSHWKVVRVLDLSSTNIRELPYSFRALIHLRYLDLSYTRIKRLPGSICRLCFLQTLKISHSLLCALPKEMIRINSLRHLEIHATCMSYLPHGMGRLTRIRTLSDFIVGHEIGCSISELGNLKLLQGKLIISNLTKVINREEAEKAKLNERSRINYLILDGQKHFTSQCLDRKRYIDPPILEHMYKEATGLSNEIEVNEIEMTRALAVLEGIKPHVNLRRLEIWNYIGPTFPNWIEDALLSKLVFLKLVECVKVKTLPPLGMLPSLKCLHIQGMVEVEHIGHESYGDGDVKGFPKLECLILKRMPNWKEWDLNVEEGHMSCVVELIISDCPCLKTLPDLPKTLRELTFSDCPNMKTMPCLPNTVRKLEIYNCEVLPHDNSLPTVEELVLKGQDGMLCSLPNLPNLKSLKITMSSDLTSLPVGLGLLTTLKTLTIHFCPKLCSLPHFTMLQELIIAGCPLLTEQCRKEQMDGWLKIAHIPSIEIDNKKIQGYEEIY